MRIVKVLISEPALVGLEASAYGSLTSGSKGVLFGKVYGGSKGQVYTVNAAHPFLTQRYEDETARISQTMIDLGKPIGEFRSYVVNEKKPKITARDIRREIELVLALRNVKTSGRNRLEGEDPFVYIGEGENTYRIDFRAYYIDHWLKTAHIKLERR